MKNSKDERWVVEPDEVIMVICRDEERDRWVNYMPVTAYQYPAELLKEIEIEVFELDEIESIWRVDILERSVVDITRTVAGYFIDMADDPDEGMPRFVMESEAYEEYVTTVGETRSDRDEHGTYHTFRGKVVG